MRIHKLLDCPETTAGDGARLRELVYPDRPYPFEGRYSLAHGTVPPGERTAAHVLTTDEVYHILGGKGILYVGEELALVEPGDTIEVPPATVQWIENPGAEPLTFLCLVDPAWRPEDETIIR